MTRKYIIGTDEVGTGAISGPVTIGACYIPPEQWEELKSWGFTDSKKLKEPDRRRLYQELHKRGTELGVEWSCASVTPQEIDSMSPLDAQFKAARTAILVIINQLGARFDEITVIVDGVHVLPNLPSEVEQIAIPKADLNYLPVSVASVMAKHTRDSYMIEINKEFPIFGFDRNKGYPTLEHLTVLLKLGPIYGVHRRHYLKRVLQVHYEKYMKYTDMVKPAWLEPGVWLDDEENVGAQFEAEGGS